MTSQTLQTPQALAQRLKADTAATHEAMHELMGALSPFASRDRYVRFVAAQYVFQRRVQALAGAARLDAIIPDLAARTRSEAAAQDLADLSADVSPPCREWLEQAMADRPGAAAGAHALGWLYVSEGSTLGAAFLFKEAQSALGLSAQFGARNLAASPAGRAQAWKGFVSALNDAPLSSAQCDQVVAGALDAFAFFGQTLRAAFSDAQPAAGRRLEP